MSKIFINGKFLTYRQTGAQRYAREIVSCLDELFPKGKAFIVLPKGEWDVPHYKNIRVIKTGLFKGAIWEQTSFPLYVLFKRGISVNLCNVAPLLVPGFSAIFDMKIKSFPCFYNKRFRLWYNILFANQTKRCNAIFTDSEDAKREILKYYPQTSPDKIQVAYASWEHFYKVGYDEGSLQKYGLEKSKYCFAMGSLEPNKNFRWVAEIAKKNPDLHFAVAGALNESIFAEGLGFECPGNMKLLGFVSDEEAKTLMRDAKAFLFPSFCEGFGMPPLEALSAGCPRVIVSDIPVMHEIFENNAIYIKPYEYNYNLIELLENSSCDKESVLKRFSWRQSAEIVYNEIKNKYSKN